MGEFRLTRAAQSDLDRIGRHSHERWGSAQRDYYLGLLDKAFRQLAKSDIVVVRVFHHARDVRRAF